MSKKTDDKGGKSESKPDAQKTYNDQELRTLLATVWQHTIAPHELQKGVIKTNEKKNLADDVTIVPADTMPQGSFAETLLDGAMAKRLTDTQRGQKTTMITSLETRRGGTGSALPDTMFQSPPTRPDVTGTQTIKVDTQAGGVGPASPSERAKAETRMDNKKPSGYSPAHGSAAAIVRAAQKHASGSISKLVVQEKVVMQKAANTQILLKEQPDFEIREKLGEGGMGTVYVARQTSIDRQIALKMIKPDLAKNPDIQAVFLAEAAVTGDLEHPNIIPIYELGVQKDGVLFYAMKQAKGVAWKDVLSEKKVEENIDILMKVADAVAFAHSKGVIHRDLKPENIMLGEFGEVLVMDWGLAASVIDDGKVGRLTKANAAGGTPAYMAPEMCIGEVDMISYQSDVYLLGAMLYEILTGKRPHTGKNMMDLLYNVATNAIQPTDKKDSLIDIARTAMGTRPEDRYPTVKEFQDAVRSTLKHRESIALANKAQVRLDLATEKQEYEIFSQALFGFQEANDLWDGNQKANQGLIDTREAYAQAAIAKEDYDLAASTLDPVKELFPDLDLVIRREIKSRAARRFRIRALSYASVVLVAVFVVGLSIAYFKVEEKRKEAENQRVLAELERENALKSKQEADEERQKALDSQREAEQQREAAVTAKDEAEKRRVEADEARKDALRQKQLVEEQRQEAITARQQAEASREQAEERRVEAEKAQKEAEKRRIEADEQRKIALERYTELTRIGGLKERIQQSTPPEVAARQQADAAKKHELKQFWTIPLGEQSLEVALVPEGNFVMGSDVTEDYRQAEEYLHNVVFEKPYYMARFEFTQGQWKAVMGQPPAPVNGDGDDPVGDKLPVYNVTYEQVVKELLPKLQAFAPKGYVFRLPTEAEWEFACRSGAYTPFFGGGEKSMGRYGWCQLNSEKTVHPVGAKEPNAWGLYDMHGNVSEMCLDYYDRDFYLSPDIDKGVNLKESKFHVVRGGSWINLPQHCRSAYRSYVHPLNQYDHLGFRVVLVPAK